jgi:hypothetical protein
MAYTAESIYGVQLLDDLHNYFPELLYNSGRFQNVQDVLQYITAVTRRRFDLFTYGREVYSTNLANAQRQQGVNTTHAMDMDETASVPASVPSSVPMPASAPAPVTMQQTPSVATGPSLIQSLASASRFQPRRTYASLFTSPIAQQPATPPTSSLDSLLQLLQPSLVQPQPIVTATYSTTDDEATSWLMSLLTGGSGNGGRAGFPASFLEPIPVFPTREQVRVASTVRTLDTSDVANTCTICQDDMSEGNTIRTLNTCQHTFHISCIDTWLASNVRCPVCRHDIRETAGAATDQKDGEEGDGDEDEL